jgi:Ca2+-binding RTX toxin-like protein
MMLHGGNQHQLILTPMTFTLGYSPKLHRFINLNDGVNMLTITINLARRGPSFSGEGYAEVGRMWYSLTDSNGISSSYGFVPGRGATGIDQAVGAGQVNTHGQNDDLYQGPPDLTKTIEITQAQYDAMQSFGLQPERHGFDVNYNEISNKGIAFTWKAIQLGELNIHDYRGWGRQLFGDATPLDADSFTALAQEDNNRDGQVNVVRSGLTAGNRMYGLDGNEQITNSTGIDTLRGGAGKDTLVGGTGNDTLVGGTGKDSLYGGTGNDLLFGGAGKDTLHGGMGNDILFGDKGKDSLHGGAGNDILYGGTGKDSLHGGAGNDILYGGTGKDSLYGGTGNDILYGGTGKDSLYGGAGNDILYGGTGKDSLHGGAGNDILYGGTGKDSLTNASGTAFLNGGTGNDTLTGGASAELYLGGHGDDTVTTGAGNNVILFNKGDGQDTLAADGTRGTGNDTLSLGGNFTYSDLSLSKSNNDLILKIGDSDQLTFQDWYAARTSRTVVNLQVISEAMSDFSAGGSNPLLDQKVETFNFTGLVTAFDVARAAAPALNTWSLNDALLKSHLAGSDSAAFGGDLAYRYGKNDSVGGLTVSVTQDVINDSRFGNLAQTL